MCPLCLVQQCIDNPPEQGALDESLGPEWLDRAEVTQAFAGKVGSRRFGDYELLKEIAHGGMGMVYKARQISLNRVVALKTILAGSIEDKTQVKRFRAEAQAAAQLRHPNIVAIYETGVYEGQHYFTMDFVEGQSLAQITARNPLPPRKAAEYLQVVARTVHYAHQRGILHRDLKPSNVLIEDATDAPRVTDFGLARRIEGGSDLTLSGQVVGTASYMPPEQAAGKLKELGPWTDVYALGATLYEALTGRPPHRAASTVATLKLVLEAEPAPPRIVNPAVPKDLETICLKCLEKERGKRFASAEELADELGRFLRNEPIRTRPARRVEKTWRWCKRKPALAGLAGAVAALAIISTVAAIGLGVARQRQEREQYYADIGLAKYHIEEGNIDRALELLLRCPARYRRWEWGHLLYLCHQDIRTIAAHTNVQSMANTRTKPWLKSLDLIRFSPDGQSLLTLGAYRTARVWDVADGHELFACGGPSNRVETLAFSPDATRLATVEGEQTIVRDARTGAALLEFQDLRGTATHLAWAPHGQQLAVGTSDGSIQVRDPSNGKRLLEILGGKGPLMRLFYTPEGLRLVRQDPGRCASYDAKTGQELEVVTLSREEGVEMMPDPEMKRFVSRDRGYAITLREVGGASQILDKVGQREEGGPFAVFSPDGRRFATRGNPGTAKVWDAVTRRPLFVIPDRVYAMAFSPDGKRLATAGNKTVAHVWDIDTSREVRALRGHQELVELVAFSPDGRLVVTGGRDGIVKLWSATDGREVIVHRTIPWGFAVSRDGKKFTSGPVADGVTVRDSRSGRALLNLKVNTDYALTVGFSPDGTRLVTSSRFREPRVWDLTTGQCLFTLKGHTRAVAWCVSFSPDGRRIATGSPDLTTRLWDAQNGRPLHVLTAPSNGVDGVAFSPDSRLLVSGSGGGQDAILWDVESGRLLRRFHAHEDSVRGGLFSPDGSQIVTAGLDNKIRFWDVRSGRPNKELRLRGYPLSMALSPDGKRLFSWTVKTTAMEQDIPAFEVWDTEAGRQILTLSGHQDVGNGLDISADGKKVLTSAFDGTVRQWEIFPWVESDYPGSAQTPLASRVRQYADRYWTQRLGDEAAAAANQEPVRKVEIPFDRSLIPPRDPKAPPQLIDLTACYTSPLNRPSHPSLAEDFDDDLRNLPLGIATYRGIAFDARGVIHLRPSAPIYAEPVWQELPAKVDGIAIRHRVRRLHLLNGTEGRESDGIAIATLVWHFADGQRRESELIYGRHVRTWWVSQDANSATPDARIAWEGTNPAATDYARDNPVREPGKDIRIYVSSWENPRPDTEVVSLDLVSRETESAPFFLGITFE